MAELTKQNDPMNFTIKSKLVLLQKLLDFIFCFLHKQGEEGRIDTEQARELNKLHIEMNNICKDLQKVNGDLFAQEMIKKGIIS